jgi:hypothetical protein
MARALGDPFGETMTYGQLSEKSDAPAGRAVGAANSKNSHALIVPGTGKVAAGAAWGGYTPSWKQESFLSLKVKMGVLQIYATPPTILPQQNGRLRRFYHSLSTFNAKRAQGNLFTFPPTLLSVHQTLRFEQPHQSLFFCTASFFKLLCLLF